MRTVALAGFMGVLAVAMLGCRSRDQPCQRDEQCGSAPWVCSQKGVIVTRMSETDRYHDCVYNYPGTEQDGYCRVPCASDADCRAEYGGTRCTNMCGVNVCDLRL